MHIWQQGLTGTTMVGLDWSEEAVGGISGLEEGKYSATGAVNVIRMDVEGQEEIRVIMEDYRGRAWGRVESQGGFGAEMWSWDVGKNNREHAPHRGEGNRWGATTAR